MYSFIPGPKRESQKYVMNSTNDLNNNINVIQEIICWRYNWSHVWETITYSQCFALVSSVSLFVGVGWRRQYCYELTSPVSYLPFAFSLIIRSYFDFWLKRRKRFSKSLVLPLLIFSYFFLNRSKLIFQ